MKEASFTVPSCWMWQAIFTPCVSSHWLHSAPAATMEAVSRPEKEPPPRQSSKPK